MNVRPVTPADREWIAETVIGALRFGADRVARRAASRTRRCSTASRSSTTVGRSAARSVNVVDGDAELVVLVTTYRGAGAGTALLEAVVERGRQESWTRLWLVTSNDNIDAIRMYQRAGWDWVDFRRDAITRGARAQARDPRHGQPRHPGPPRDRVRSAALTFRGCGLTRSGCRGSRSCARPRDRGHLLLQFQNRQSRTNAPRRDRDADRLRLLATTRRRRHDAVRAVPAGQGPQGGERDHRDAQRPPARDVRLRVLRADGAQPRVPPLHVRGADDPRRVPAAAHRARERPAPGSATTSASTTSSSSTTTSTAASA